MNSAVGATKKIFVGGLHYETKDGAYTLWNLLARPVVADFKKYFMQYGKVVSAEVMFNRETNKSRGFGFVIFESEASVELVLQDKNHVIDGKSVEVKRAVPRTDVPPPRSVSSRGGSFSSAPGPGSVGSLDDVSTATTPPVSLSGSVPSNSGLAAAVGNEKMSRASAANLMPNGTLVGYAAAVRFGGRGLPKAPSTGAAGSISSVTSPRPLSSNGDVNSVGNGISLETATVSGVADALSSLVLGDGGSSRGGGVLGGGSSAASPPLSASSSSRGSSDHLVDASTGNGHLSPLDVALNPLNTDPVMEQWNLSPSSAPQLSAEVPLGSPSEASYLPHGLVGESTQSSSHLSWQAAPWQQSWGSPPLPQQQPPLPPTPAPYFSMFSNQRGSGAPMHGAAGSSTWHSGGHGSYGNSGTGGSSSSSDGFGSGMMGMGMGMPIDGRFGSDGMGRGTFGMHGDDGNSTSYSSLGGFLQQSYLPPNHPQQQQETGVDELPLDSGSFRRMMGDEVAPDADDLHKEPSSLEYDLPSSAAEYHRQYR
ncbi:hypothetical protein BBJ28_00019421 [Nothophytophthora sp. Chile5]|nr:hypothetical protein BBJ28_00019421 [Nothophytophthora sp. Chile5]